MMHLMCCGRIDYEKEQQQDIAAAVEIALDHDVLMVRDVVSG